ncbi:MAG: hypothetical protein GVY18_02250 [Bacteroidetes bacterium]|jgi:hypothetical protein|nr:hypothetical protein [Bacteroidota bacterium]
MTEREIMAYHRAASLRGTLRLRRLHSDALGLRKPFYVYEPPGLAGAERVPMVYLLRGHEREWVNVEEDASRQRTSIEKLDRAIAAGELPPLVAVMPGLNSTDNHVPSLGIDMVGPGPERRRGLGTGRFWTFLTDELIPRLDRDYPQTQGGLRLGVGFSLGGYTVSLLALLRPGWLDHAAIYDGLLMWPGHDDPRAAPEATGADCQDPVWCTASIFDAAFGAPRDLQAMHRWNATDRLLDASPAYLQELQTTTFWVGCAPADKDRGNRDRARYFVELLRDRDLPLGFERVIIHPQAAHTWHWADRFLLTVLRRSLSGSER